MRPPLESSRQGEFRSDWSMMLVMAMEAANTSSGCMTSSDIPETALKLVQNRYLNHHFGDRYFSRVSLFFLILIVVLLRTR